MAGLANGYAYVRDNPFRFIDPLGLYTEVIQWGPAHATSPIPPPISGGWHAATAWAASPAFGFQTRREFALDFGMRSAY